jgi:hypothetical protein
MGDSVNEHQAMTDEELLDHIEFLREAKYGIEKQVGGLAHSAWDSIPSILASLGSNHLLVREYRRLNTTLVRAKAEQDRRGGVI